MPGRRFNSSIKRVMEGAKSAMASDYCRLAPGFATHET
jgi:hypothetical protein